MSIHVIDIYGVGVGEKSSHRHLRREWQSDWFLQTRPRIEFERKVYFQQGDQMSLWKNAQNVARPIFVKINECTLVTLEKK
jgi:hypothetical protein